MNKQLENHLFTEEEGAFSSGLCFLACDMRLLNKVVSGAPFNEMSGVFYNCT